MHSRDVGIDGLDTSPDLGNSRRLIGKSVDSKLRDRDLLVIDCDTEASHKGRFDVAHKLLGRLRGKSQDVDLLDDSVNGRYYARSLDLGDLRERALDVLNGDMGRTLIHREPSWFDYCY